MILQAESLRLIDRSKATLGFEIVYDAREQYGVVATTVHNSAAAPSIATQQTSLDHSLPPSSTRRISSPGHPDSATVILD